MALMSACGLRSGTRLRDVSLDIHEGELLGVIGPNGAGKSTLLQCLAGLLGHSGELTFDGTPLRDMPAPARARQIGYLPQTGGSAWALRVWDVLALGRLPWGGADAREDEAAIRAAARQTGIESLLTRRVDQLSGGEQARVWLARVLAGQPRLILADEPIASLDLYYQRGIMDRLREQAAGRRAVALAIHDLPLAVRYCDRLCLLHSGKVHAIGHPAEVLTPENLLQVFRVSDVY